MREVLDSAFRTSDWLKRLHYFSCRSSQPSAGAKVMAAEILSLVQTWENTNVPFVANIAADLPPVACDPEAFKELLHCLVDNARRACGSGGAVTLRIGARQLDVGDGNVWLGNPQAGHFAEVTVADTGTGIAPGVRDLLFQQPFFSGTPGQIGLGLAEVYGILRRFHGGLQWHSDLGKGSTFQALLPFLEKN